MSNKEERIYPGELLSTARKKKRRRYKKLSDELGIPEKYLEALENNDFDEMAGPAYVKGYLRAYAKKLGLDSDLVINAFNDYMRDQRKKKKKKVRKDRKKKLGAKLDFKSENIIAIGIMLIAAFLITYFSKN
ncbi:MAG: helix-turn-helix domain-containing protein [Gammaproteobacteria bacterium]